MPPRPTDEPPGPEPKLHRGSSQGHLATLIWKACLDAGHPIGVPASRHAAATALQVCDPPPPMADWPALMVELHEQVRWADWGQPGLLAAALRRHADRLDRAAHDACVAAAGEEMRGAA